MAIKIIKAHDTIIINDQANISNTKVYNNNL